VVYENYAVKMMVVFVAVKMMVVKKRHFAKNCEVPFIYPKSQVIIWLIL